MLLLFESELNTLDIFPTLVHAWGG